MADREDPQIVSPRALFRTFAIAETFTWAGLVAALLLRALDIADLVPIAGGIHGFVFLSYATATVFVWVNQRWRAPVGVAGLILAVVPFATVPFDLVVDRRGLLAGGWRLTPGGDAPRGFVEQVQAWILRHVALSVVLLLALVALVFLILLWLGPPIPQG